MAGRDDGPVIVITGSGRGIGRETARLALDRGYRVVINGRDATRLAATTTDIAAADPQRLRRVAAVTADAATPDGARTLIAAAHERFGAVDVLVNNAGRSMRGPAAELAPTAIEALIAANLGAAVYPTVAALPSLAARGGTIVFVSTVAAMTGFPGVSLYGATKCAAERFGESVAAEHPELTVRTVLLGFVENDDDKEILAADGTSFRHARRAQMSQRDAAEVILRAAAARRGGRSIAIRSGRLLAAALRIAPRATRRVLARSGGSIHRVERSDGSRPAR